MVTGEKLRKLIQPDLTAIHNEEAGQRQRLQLENERLNRRQETLLRDFSRLDDRVSEALARMQKQIDQPPAKKPAKKQPPKPNSKKPTAPVKDHSIANP